jgi:hypothetical protein
MTTERSGKFHFMVWALVILAVPVLYVLSVAPVTCYAYWRLGGDRWPGDPDWLEDYERPYHLIRSYEVDTHPQRWMEAYEDWWFEMTGQTRDAPNGP